MHNKTFEQEEVLQPWFESDTDYLRLYKLHLKTYLNSRQLQRNISLSLRETYFGIRHLLLRNTTVAVIILMMALSGITAVAAEIFAPQGYKPSQIFRLNRETLKEDSFDPQNLEKRIQRMSKVRDIITFEDCLSVGGILRNSFSPTPYCEYGELNFPKIEPKVDTQTGWNIFLDTEYGLEISAPKDFLRTPSKLAPTGGSDVFDLYKQSTGKNNTPQDRLFISVNEGESDNLLAYAERIFQEDKQNYIELKVFDNPDFSSTIIENMRMDYQITEVPNGQILEIRNIFNLGKLFLAKSNFNNDIFSLALIKDFKESKEIIRTVKFFEPQPKKTKLTYSNPKMPQFSFQYSPDWQLSESKTGEDILVTLIKNGKEIQFDFKSVPTFITTNTSSTCTDNTDLYKHVGNGMFRIQNNEGDLFYTESVLQEVDYALFGYELVSDEESRSIQENWVIGQPGDYRMCVFNHDMVVFTYETKKSANNLPYPGQMALKITVKNITLEDVQVINEVDQIVGSTNLYSGGNSQ